MRTTLDFLLYDWLAVETLARRERYGDHSRETFDSVLDNCERLARDKFAPFNRLVDTEEPSFDGQRVSMPQATTEAALAYAASGMLAASQDYDFGGMQLPCVIAMSGNAFFFRASVGLAAYGMLTSGNANLLMVHGTVAQRRVFAASELAGRWFGTMCLSETQAGSSLGDLTTRAVPDGADFEGDPLGPRYRLTGNKMWISAGEHEIVENIVHLVLAKIPDASGALPAGAKGISLFVVPKVLVDAEGQLTGERNDVALAGLNHKLGYRGATNTLLNFGEGKFPVRGGAGAIGYRVGLPGEGLKCMFHMMNEARIGVGLGAAMLGYAGYEASLDYARNRPQGRALGAGGKDPLRPQVRIVEHADVKRMLLAQKAYVEGALALELYCARLVDEQQTGEGQSVADAALLLEVLTPIAKSWPSEWCLEANSLAIQVLGGYGYTRDYPVEQYWRDNRLNMIHEGTHGIQALDLLGRKVLMDGGAGLKLLAARIGATVQRAAAVPELSGHAGALAAALERVGSATQKAWATGVPEEALANAMPYLQAFGHTVLAWLWLDVALAAQQALPQATGDRADLLRGKLAAMRYFFGFELPKVDAWLAAVVSRDPTCREMQDAWF
jgi:alkylation response protein AidB-like acyl-CoA dehydrogenase